MNPPSNTNKRMKQYTGYEPEEILDDLGVPKSGMTDEKAEEMRRRYGANRAKKGGRGWGKDTIPRCFFRAFLNPFSVMLCMIALFSGAMDLWLKAPGDQNGSTAVIIGLMVGISGSIRMVQEIRSRRAADRLKRLFCSRVRVRRNGTLCEREAGELVVGDRVLFEAGDRILADMRVWRADHLFVSQAALTGESETAEKTGRPVLSDGTKSWYSCENLVFLGSTVVSGRGEGIVLAVGSDTVYGDFSRTDSVFHGSFEQGSNSVIRVLIRFAAVLMPIVFLLSGIVQGNWMGALLFALSVAVGLIPEMLPMVVTACLAKGSRSLTRRQTIVRDMNAMQGFGSMDILCADKTGTLTHEEILLEYYMDILGNESAEVLDRAFLNSHFLSGLQTPIDRAIQNCRFRPGSEEHFQRLGESLEKLWEIPFDHVRKCASVALRWPDGRAELLVKGDVDAVLERCRYISYQGEALPMETADGNARDSVYAVVEEMLQDGMKVVAVAGRSLDVFEGDSSALERDLVLMGYLAFFDAPKDTAASAIAKLRHRNVRTKILTGDHSQVAVSVCRRVGIDASAWLTGSQINEMDDERLSKLSEQTDVFAELSPNQKARVLRALKKNGHTVGFLGDGMNDIPAICEADVGISVDTAVDAAKDVADVVLLKKDLNVLESGILEGRNIFANMTKYIRITASSNFGNIFSIVCASAFFPFLQMTSMQILLLNLLYDMICIALPWDHVDREACASPREWSGKHLGRFMLVFGPISSIFDIITFLALYFVICPGLCGGMAFEAISDPALKSHFIALFQTGWFLESMWTQVFIIHLLRTDKISFLQSRASRPVLCVTTAGIVCFTALTMTPAAEYFGLTAMPVWYFAYLAVIVAAYLLLTTAVKQWYRRGRGFW